MTPEQAFVILLDALRFARIPEFSKETVQNAAKIIQDEIIGQKDESKSDEDPKNK